MFKPDPKTIVSRNCLQTIFSRHFLKESRRKKDIFEPYLPTRISTAQHDHAEGVEDGVRPVVHAPANLGRRTLTWNVGNAFKRLPSCFRPQ